MQIELKRWIVLFAALVSISESATYAAPLAPVEPAGSAAVGRQPLPMPPVPATTNFVEQEDLAPPAMVPSPIGPAPGAEMLFPPATQEPGREIYAMPVPNGYERRSSREVEDVFDQAGPNGNEIPPIRRAPYPYGHNEYWYGHDADIESWGAQLLELPYVRLGWYASMDTTVFQPSTDTKFVGNLANGVFADPVTLGAAGLNWNASPKLNLGYRFEHGLGEIQVGYRYFTANGSDPLPSFGAGGNLSTNINFQTIDLDWCTLDFNAEGLPFVFPLLKSWGRAGLGKALTPNWFEAPLEMRWIFGLRGATFYYDSVGQGAAMRERVMSNFNGVGLHFAIDLNQRLRTKAPIYIHARGEGSGMFGFVDQQFERDAGGLSDIGRVIRDGIGVPTATIELGLAYDPCYPVRSVKYTLAWQREQWFCFGNGGDSSADLIMQGILLRGEYKY